MRAKQLLMIDLIHIVCILLCTIRMDVVYYAYMFIAIMLIGYTSLLMKEKKIKFEAYVVHQLILITIFLIIMWLSDILNIGFMHGYKEYRGVLILFVSIVVNCVFILIQRKYNQT